MNQSMFLKLAKQNTNFGTGFVEITNDRIFKAYASVEDLDVQGDIVKISALKEVMETWYSRGGLLMDSHTNMHVGKGLSWGITKVDGFDALWVQGEVFKDYTSDNDMWDGIQSGEYTGLSIGGRALKGHRECDTITCWTVLTKVELVEISFVRKPANGRSLIFEKQDSVGIAMSKKSDNLDSIPKENAAPTEAPKNDDLTATKKTFVASGDKTPDKKEEDLEEEKKKSNDLPNKLTNYPEYKKVGSFTQDIFVSTSPVAKSSDQNIANNSNTTDSVEKANEIKQDNPVEKSDDDCKDCPDPIEKTAGKLDLTNYDDLLSKIGETVESTVTKKLDKFALEFNSKLEKVKEEVTLKKEASTEKPKEEVPPKQESTPEPPKQEVKKEDNEPASEHVQTPRPPVQKTEKDHVNKTLGTNDPQQLMKMDELKILARDPLAFQKLEFQIKKHIAKGV